MTERPSHPLTRRAFLAATGGGAVALAAPRGLYAGSPTPAKHVAFNTANLVARVTGYRFELSHWMDQHNKTIATTDEVTWRAICKEVAAAGFQTVEVWEAHAAPESLDEAKARVWKRILDDHGLTPVAYAGGLRPETLRICQWLGIPHVDGGLRDNTPEKATALCREHGVRFNIENHPEKSAAGDPREDRRRQRLARHLHRHGLARHTGGLGPCGHQGLRAVRAAHPRQGREGGGEDETCLLGDGSADVAGCMAALRR